MVYEETKVYSDGSHYIAIPKTTRPTKKKKKASKDNIELKEKADKVFEENKGKKKVEKKELPTLTDKLVADTTDFETVEEYKNDLRAKLLEAEEQKAQRSFENQVIEAVVNASTVDIPAILIDNEVEHILKDLKQRLAYQRIGLEDYMSYMGTTVEEFKKHGMDRVDLKIYPLDRHEILNEDCKENIYFDILGWLNSILF